MNTTLNGYPENGLTSQEKGNSKEAQLQLRILDRIGVLERHILNLIFPIQEATKILKTPDLRKIVDLLMHVTDRLNEVLAAHSVKFQNQFDLFREYMDKLDLHQTFSEIKYIGNRLKEIEEILEKIKEEGVKRKIICKIETQGIEDNFDVIRSAKSVKIEDCELSIRSQNMLNAMGITILGELCSYSEIELRKYRGCGKTTVRELVNLLDEHGLKLRP